MAEETYADWTLAELREEAATRDLEGRSAMNKDELVAALEADDAGEEVAEAPAEAEEEQGTAAAVLAKARAEVAEALAKVDEELADVDRTDPAHYRMLKADRAALFDALNHHLTLDEQYQAEAEDEEAEAEAEEEAM